MAIVDDPVSPTASDVEPALSGPRAGVADALTLGRALLAPVIMAVILWGWRGEPSGTYTLYPDMLRASLWASLLFGFAALSDALDDAIGGAKTAGARRFGWFDDIADSILVDGTLLALAVATWRAGALGPGLVVPVVVIVGRDAALALGRGYELSRQGWTQTALGTLKNALAMLFTLVLVAAPWLTNLILQMRGADALADPAGFLWSAGVVGLWGVAALSLVTGLQLWGVRLWGVRLWRG